LTTCTTTKDVDLVWEDFANFYTFTYFSIHLLEHASTQFLDLQHFLDLGCVHERKMHTLDWVKMYTIKFLRVGTKNKPTMNLIMP